MSGRVVLPALALLVALSASAADGLPKGWFRNNWNGYQPYATIETVPGPLDGLEAIHVSDVTARYGFGVLSQGHLPAVDGDRIHVTFFGKGRGRAAIGYVSFTKDGEWNQPGPDKAVELTDEWTLYECDLTVSDKIHRKPTGQVQTALLGYTGSECWFADVRTEVVPAKAEAGTIPEVRELRDRKGHFHEGFEKPARGTETLVTDIAPGLLQKTRIGVFRTKGSLALPAKVRGVRMPPEADRALAAGSRLYSLKGAFSTTVKVGGREIALVQRAVKEVGALVCEVFDGKARVGAFRVPRRILPADVRIDLTAAGGWGVDVSSLADSSVRHYAGRLSAPVSGAAEIGWTLSADDAGKGGVAVDELEAFTARIVAKSSSVPYRIDRLATFDPVAAGWPLVFEDEFEGGEIDWSKWYYPHYAGQHRDCVRTDGEGHLVIEAKPNGKGGLVTDGIWSTAALEYGYFEARVKFTKKPGWWAAFWLYGAINDNPFIDGFEIDIFEDYYTRPREPGGKPGVTLDHNNHVNTGPVLKSWNFNSAIPGDPDGWHVIACKWTPFEISYYMDGRIIPSRAGHGAYDSVTFDAIHHFAGIAPLHAICSGQIGKMPKDANPADYPERYLVDRVRIFAYPQPKDEFPSVAWRRGPDERAIVSAGSMLRFEVEAKPTKPGASVSGVYLFDNGYLIDYRTEPPYDFDVRFSAPAYEYTNYMKPGRSGKKPAFDGSSHVFVAFAQDSDGRVSHTEPVWRIPAEVKSVPYEDVVPAIPGRISSVRFDAGGRGVSQYTREGRNRHWAPTRTNDTVTASASGWVGVVYGGDWLNYTVDIAEAGTYSVKAMVSTGIRQQAALRFFLDGRPVGRLALDSFTTWRRGDADDCGETSVTLPAGRHVLTVGIEGGVTFRHLEFTRK